MSIDFWTGFAVGMAFVSALSCFIFAFAPKKPNVKKEIDYKVVKPPVIQEHLQPVKVSVKVDIPYEELRFVNEEWHKGNITGKLKLKMIEKLWDFVRVEMIQDPNFFQNSYIAKLLVLLPDKDAFLYEVTKQEL